MAAPAAPEEGCVAAGWFAEFVGGGVTSVFVAIAVSLCAVGFWEEKGFGILDVTAARAGGRPSEATWICEVARCSRAATYSVCHLSRSSLSRDRDSRRPSTSS